MSRKTLALFIFVLFTLEKKLSKEKNNGSVDKTVPSQVYRHSSENSKNVQTHSFKTDNEI